MLFIMLTYSAWLESLLYLWQVIDGAPALCDQTLLCHIQVEHVQCVVDGFDLAHLDEPNLDVLGSCYQHSVTMILGLRQHLKSAQHGMLMYNNSTEQHIFWLGKK